ncbi:MAG: winged helix-turn-helix domain-containing protein [Hamadaea sp.]|uniref:winged helix-turn-helix domain-containing protein n=1 Tax=Hamadaea sp. TaxID=2024425 RepID=UPI0017AA7AFB|nr:crosslink repair DNA glycosylase YcaQ family protein [Hamadaea sp.]NUR74066.1 winged helix-turn-helix domain-containing protein [Hamadaea sp.]NUT19759.1 winged helix-turn-helix domain-containing protein [Hamadaea sp.]
MLPMETLTLTQARRIALAASGFGGRALAAPPTGRHLRRVVESTGLLQIDSVNVLQRAHYLPAYSRIGPYETALLDRGSSRRPRWLFEYWAHEASLVPVELQPDLRWRMATAREKAWGGPRSIARERPELVEWVLAEVADRGPVTAAEIEADVPKPKGDNWGWNWSDVKKALEFLFYEGSVTSAGRNTSFARRYDLTSRVLPAEVVGAPTPAAADAHRRLVERAARALGVAAEAELRDYFRLPVDGARQAIADLVDGEVLVPVQVKGWKPQAYLHREAPRPRRFTGGTLISPFDPLIWERGRTERLFGLRYRIEIYVPEPQRVHGYYVLPFLQGERFTARVDLKADRKAGVLRVPAAWLEPGADPESTAPALRAELDRLAGWLGLSGVDKAERGDLAAFLNGVTSTA